MTSKDKTEEIISLTKIRKLIGYIQGSVEMQQELKEMCKLLGVEFSLPVIGENFSSTFTMIEKALHLQQPLRALCSKTPEFIISEVEWEELHILKKLLHKFHRASEFIPISSYLATLNWLSDSLDSLATSSNGNLACAVKTCLTTIKQYNVRISDSKIPFIATLLNPALKMTYFKEHNYSQSNIREIEKGIHEIFKKDYEVKGSVLTDKSEDEDDELFSHMFKRAKTEKMSKEVQKFLRYPLSSPKSDVLEFWKLNESEFPCLAGMARDYLAVSSSEHFQEANVKKEESFTAESIRASHCLEHWLKQKNF